jgi:hypothetical protein
MDTEIEYKYKDGFHKEIRTGSLTTDRGLFKAFIGCYDKPESELTKRLNHCALISRGHQHATIFLETLNSFWKEQGPEY